MAVRNGYPDMALGDLYPFEDHYLDLDDGTTMHYIQSGKAGMFRPTFLLLHGNPTWSFLYRNFMQPLSKYGRVVALDHIGFGRSDHPRDPAAYTLEKHIANLEEFVAKKGLKRIIPVVHDWGGPIGLGFATRHPDLLRGLVLLNTWAFVEREPLRLPFWYKILAGPLGKPLIAKRNLYVERFLPRFTLTDLPDEVMDAYRHPQSTPEGRTAILATARGIPTKPNHPNWATLQKIEKSLPDLDVPTQILWAAKDPAFPKRFAWAFHELLPGATEPKWFEAGHFLQEDVPDELTWAIAEFIEGL